MTPGRSHYYQFIASNASGITKGPIQVSIVSPIKPVVNSMRADNSKAGQVTFIGNVNAGGTNTRWYLIYSKSKTLVTGPINYPVLAADATVHPIAVAIRTSLG